MHIFHRHLFEPHRHLFEPHFGGLLLDSPISFALYTTFFGPLKRTEYFLTHFLRMVICFSCTIIVNHHHSKANGNYP